ncbi:MAG: lipid A export permease/ATP-binding protein MsbA [Pseudomonadota bacterium]|nr:lipid A export permease/ATP-binding protein MsbA [Pseudomonadota bacterium]MDP1903401.1 lipid A export permease/ATP-binding protein MsbA [Pseudomonadota bacterium]MDP2352371.1 lipid A export permease/ATP-binding protein MsbA [Pseudomonadota bacterium]
MNSRALYFRLLTYVKPYWKVFAASIVALTMLAATEPLFPALLKPLLDEGFTNKDSAYIKWTPILLVGIALLRGTLTFVSSYASSWVATKVVTDLRTLMFDRLIHLPSSFFDNHSSGSLVSKIAYDVNNVTGAATQVLTVLVRDSLTILGLLGWLLWLDWKLTLVALTITPLIMLLVGYFGRRLRRVSRESQRSMGMITHVIEEACTSHKVVKIFQGEGFETARFDKANNVQRGFSMRATVASSAVTPLVQLFASTAVSVVIAIALSDSGGATASAGGFISFLTAMLMMLAPIKRLTDVNATLQRGLAAAESVFEMLDELQETDAGTQTVSRLNGLIEFDHVHFTYPGAEHPALSDLNLTIKPGTTVALIGRSGSGKSTVVSLLTRFYNIEQGDIRIDGIPVQNIRLQALRHHIALVSQDVRLFNDSIAANVAYATPKAEPSEIEAALRAAHAWEFVSQLPQGIDTLVGENGVKLSGGQRQRIAIARAFFKNAPILILDEATSALDTESERQVQLALEELMRGRTTLVIAHRLSTIERADCIVVMEKGRVVETGNHDELLARNSAYAHFHKLQHRHDLAETT